MIFFYCREKILCDQKAMSFAVNFFLASLAFPLLVRLTSDLEMDTTSSCALLAVSDSSGGRCNFCRNTIEYWSVRWKLQYGNSRFIRVVGGKIDVMEVKESLCSHCVTTKSFREVGTDNHWNDHKRHIQF